jgi:transcriptional regulator with XRE-family HTH domain
VGEQQADIKPILGNLAKHIKERRRILGISQEKLAERAGLSTNFLARIELGEKTPSLKTLAQLAKTLEVHVSELLEEDTSEAWLDEAQNLAKALESLSEPDVEYALGQFRNTIDYLKWKRDNSHPAC